MKSYDMPLVQGADIGRSREGAWIEIVAVDKSKVGDCGRSREGAWIEMDLCLLIIIVRACRSREGAWIEIAFCGISDKSIRVAPARERGLKFLQ